MQNDIEKLKRQVEKYEAKGYFDTAAHQMLKRLLEKKTEEGVSLGTPKKVKTEASNGK